MLSLAPLSSEIVPVPDHTPAISANGPDPAWAAGQENNSAANTPAATIPGRKNLKLGFTKGSLSRRSLVGGAALQAAETLMKSKQIKGARPKGMNKFSYLRI